MIVTKRILLYLLFILFVLGPQSLKAQADTVKYLFMGHPRYDDRDHEYVLKTIEELDYSKFDLLLLGGDLTWNTSEEVSTMEYLDSIFNLGSPSTHLAMGNHDDDDLDRLLSYTKKERFYSFSRNNITFIVLDTELNTPNVSGSQLDLIKAVADTIENSDCLVLIHHRIIWMADNPDLEHLKDSVAASSRSLSSSNFFAEVYPEFQKVKSKGIPVFCVAGDRTDVNIEYAKEDSIQFIASGMVGTFPDSNNFAVVFTHYRQEQMLNYEFVPLSEIDTFTGTPIQTKNYYISNRGDDGANGASPATAWKTFKNINSHEFNPGDNILFERGGVFRQTEYDNSYAGVDALLQITESGSKEEYITFSAYGEGARPKLYGSIATDQYASLSGNIYRSTKTFQRDPWNIPAWNQGTYYASLYYVTKDSIEWGDLHAESLADLDENYEWFWQNDSIYFYYEGDISDIDSIEVTQFARLFLADGDYLALDGLEMRYVQRALVSSSDYPEVSKQGLIVRNCNIAYSGIREGGVGYGVNLHHSDMLIEKNRVHDNGRRNLSFNITNTTGSCTMRDVTIQDNHLFNGYHTTGVDMGTHGNNHTVRNVVIRRNRMYERPDIDKSMYSLTMNFLENNGEQGDWDSIFFYNNEVLNAGTACVMLHNVGTSFVINNTFVAFPYNPEGAFGAVVYRGVGSKTTVMNNIFFIHPEEYGLYNAIWGDPHDRSAITWDTVDYNLVYIAENSNHYLASPPADFPLYAYNQSDWSELVSLGWETHSLVPPQLPNFADSLNSGRLKSNSPALGNARSIRFVDTDIEGNPRDPLTPTIGAYELIPDSIPNKMQEIKRNNSFVSIFPNPASENITIRIRGEAGAYYLVQLFDMRGKKVFESESFMADSDSFSIKHLAPGMYFLNLISDRKSVMSEKFIVR